MPTHPIPRFNDFTPEDVGSEEFLDRLTRLSRTLEYLMSHMDHDNVRRLHTNECVIQSKYGETLINGPEIKMYNKPSAVEGTTSTGVLRLKMGYDAGSSDFVFKMWNTAGSTMIELDSNGNAVFMGTLRTGSTTGERIEIAGNSMICYDSTNKRHGLVFGSSAAIGSTNSFSDMYLYHSGTKLCEIYDDLTGYCFRPPTTDNFVQLGKADCHTYVVGNVHHSGTGCKIGFFNTSPVAKTAVSTATSTTVDLLNSKLNALISALNTYGIV